MAEFVPPYIFAVTKLADFFTAIKKASVPSKFTQDYLVTTLGFKSSSDRAFIPLLKRLGFINQNNEPTEIYRKFRDDNFSRSVMGNSIKEAYPDVFNSDESADKLSKGEFSNLIKRITGFADDDRRISAIVSTFFALKEFADFEPTSHMVEPEKIIESNPSNTEQKQSLPPHQFSDNIGLGISYTINLNLPATTDIEVFNAIFKSLKENILTKE